MHLSSSVCLAALSTPDTEKRLSKQLLLVAMLCAWVRGKAGGDANTAASSVVGVTEFRLTLEVKTNLSAMPHKIH